MRRGVALLLAVFATIGVHAQTIPALRLVPATDAQGRGETLVAETGSVLLLHGNPASLAGLGGAQIAAGYRRWLQGSGLYTLAGGTPISTRGRLGLLVTAFDAAERGAIRDDDGFDVRFLQVAVAYAYGRGPLRAGVTASYVVQRDAQGESATGVAFDAGVQARALGGGVRAGAAVQHVGRVGELSGQALTLPSVLRVGVAAEPLLVAADALDLGPIARVLVAAEIVRDLAHLEGEPQETRLHVGAEVEAFDLLVGRTGYLFGDDLRGLTLGLGLRSGAFGFDFAYQPFEGEVGGTGQGLALRYTL